MIRFKAQAADLNAAIDLVRIVTPRPFDKDKTSGFLFVIRGDRCFLYSNDALYTSRADFPITDVEGEGQFIYPSANILAFKFYKGTINFEVKNEEGNFSITYGGSNGLGGAPRALYNPKFMETCDKALSESTDQRTFSANVLRECVSLAKEFQAGDKDKGDGEENPFRTIQVFDKTAEVEDPANPGKKTKPYEHGDGFMFASDRVRTIHVQCADFMGKHMLLFGNNTQLLMDYLSKCKSPVTLSTGKNKTFAVDAEGRVLGWTNSTKSHSRFTYSSGLKGCDAAVTMKPQKGDILEAIDYIQAELETGRDKVKVSYKDEKIQFTIAEGKGIGIASMFVEAPLDPASTGTPAFEINVNINWLRSLIASSKGNVVELRASVENPNASHKKQAGTFRTFDEFLLDADGKVIGGDVKAGTIPEGAIKCRVTRYSPSYVE